jgi:Domain of unknown function (DUF4349)
MNTQQPVDPGAALPELSDDRIDAMESSLFTAISDERTDLRVQNARRARRGRVWLAGGAAAAVIVVAAAVIAPSVGGLLGATSTNESAVGTNDSALLPATDGGAVELQTAPDAADGSAADSKVADESAISATGSRNIITTASATVLVDDPTSAAQSISQSAQARGGYVESMSIGQSGQGTPIDPMSNGVVTDSMTYPYPYPPSGAWVTVRVPADQLPALMEELSAVGEVTASAINRQDVTEQTVDLRARVDAAQASVDRMTDILEQAGNLTDLIAAESALAERQATLESYQQQLKYYDEQVALSTLTVTLNVPADVVKADPAGFGDGLAAGWNGLVATLNGIVIALGFLLPWIAVILVVGLIVWGIVQLVRRARRNRTTPPTGFVTEASDPARDSDD